jgi:hypothetical protein
MNKWYFIFVFSLLLSLALPAQNNYPRGYFIYPVKAPAGLAANFGELRANHYHMGLDCKTDKKENVAVVAAADGYISKVKIEPFGFGRAIYINHPNGYTTLYAHLNDFFPELEKYVRQQQYLQKSWKVFLDIPPGKFPVSKGQLIALSGNAGASQGPHLHFEIRDTRTDKVLNPLLFGFSVSDHTAPDILKLAVYDRNRSTYEQSPRIITLKKSGGQYVPVQGTIILNTDKVSFGITAFDRYSGSTNQNGIYKATLFDDEKPVLRFCMNNISYDETRYLNAHIDYKTKLSGGPYIQHLSILPGSIKGIYEGSLTDGVIDLEEGKIRQIRIEVADVNGNTSTLRFSVKGGKPSTPSPQAGGQLFKPGQFNIFENDDIAFYLPENALYDSFHFSFSKQQTASGIIYKIHNGLIPVHTYFSAGLRAVKPFRDTGKVIMKWYYGEKDEFRKAVYDKGFYRASFRNFGNFELFQDTLPPVITPIGFREGMKMPPGGRLIFRITDNAEDLAYCDGYIDGNWILFSNDKGKTFIHTFDEHTGPGRHELRIVAVDLAGNKTEKKYHFTK